MSQLEGKAALTANQQNQILAMTKNMMQARDKLKKMAASYPTSEARYRINLKEQEMRFLDFLKEL